jgi:hypothetical protein
VVELPKDMPISNTFNVAELFAYHPDNPIYTDSNSRTSFLEEGETDVEQSEEAPRSINCIISDNIREGDSGAPRQVDNVVSDNIRDGDSEVPQQIDNVVSVKSLDPSRSYSALNRGPAR